MNGITQGLILHGMDACMYIFHGGAKLFAAACRYGEYNIYDITRGVGREGSDGSGEPLLSGKIFFKLKIALNFQPWNSPVGIRWPPENQSMNEGCIT